VANVRASVCEITYATLRTICGEHTLQDILEKRQEIADVIEEFVEEKVKDWGN
jgi:regulator of protease activity HflC (stomatin/prohibitin superfamily)